MAFYTHAVSQICVKVRLFASYREAAGTARLEAPLPAGARVSDLVDMLAAAAARVKDGCMVA